LPLTIENAETAAKIIGGLRDTFEKLGLPTDAIDDLLDYTEQRFANLDPIPFDEALQKAKELGDNLESAIDNAWDWENAESRANRISKIIQEAEARGIGEDDFDYEAAGKALAEAEAQARENSVNDQVEKFREGLKPDRSEWQKIVDFISENADILKPDQLKDLKELAKIKFDEEEAERLKVVMEDRNRNIKEQMDAIRQNMENVLNLQIDQGGRLGRATSRAFRSQIPSQTPQERMLKVLENMFDLDQNEKQREEQRHRDLLNELRAQRPGLI
jgi:hypothetical protein